MKINIVQKHIDEEKLINAVNGFEIEHNQNAYLFMNQVTLNELAIFNALNVDIETNKDCSGIVSFYCGRRVFQNEDLKFGEVEIR